MLWWLACSRPAPVVDAPPPVDLKAHMQGHRAELGRIRDDLARGDLAAAHAENEVFLDHPVSADLIGDWQVRVSAMGEASVALRDATDLPAAATAAASLAASCAECHRAVGVQPPYTAPTVPAGAGHAARQTAALDQLFAGLWNPSVSWDSALAAVRDAGTDPMVAGVEPLAAALANPAPVEAAGAVVAACAACHAGGPAGVYPIRDAAAWQIAGGTAALVLGPREGSPRAAVQELRLAAGATVPPHVHPDSDELLIVLAGRVEMLVDGKPLTAGPDDVVRVPAGQEHSAKVLAPLRAMQIYVGPGPERRFTAGERAR